MTSGIKVTHPNGTTFEHIPAYRWHYFKGIGYRQIPNACAHGVRVTYADGVKRFISKTWYDDLVS